MSLRIFRHCKEHGPDIYIESFIDRDGGDRCPLCESYENERALLRRLARPTVVEDVAVEAYEAAVGSDENRDKDFQTLIRIGVRAVLDLWRRG